jgi:hypothetical protein
MNLKLTYVGDMKEPDNKCPLCMEKFNKICDNDCGTYFCCGNSWHWDDKDETYVKGHAENCGIWQIDDTKKCIQICVNDLSTSR